MTRDEVYATWAPDEAMWTPWVKPVLFGCMDEQVEPSRQQAPEAWLRAELLQPLGELSDLAVVIDLPGASGVTAGLAFADHGFRPVPLYNAIQQPDAFIDLREIMTALVDGAARVARISPQARPAFLLDSRRMTGWPPKGRARPYDNRSVVRGTDFPSVSRLRFEGVRRVLVVLEKLDRRAADLEVVLEDWERAGFQLFCLSASEPAAPRAFSAKRSWGQRLLHWLTVPPLRRADGAYGRFWTQGG